MLAAGARILFVGTGLPAMAADFARTHAGQHAVFSDAQRQAFGAAGLRRSWWAFLHWRFVANLWRALCCGFRQGRIEGDALQQGGVLVVDARGQALLAMADAAMGDRLDLGAIVTAARPSG